MQRHQTYTLKHRGSTLSYTVTGEGTPVVFVQGVGLHGEGWRPQVNSLCKFFQCLTFDNRGIGKSQLHQTQDLSIEIMVQDLNALIEAQHWGSAHIVGHSMGGLIAQKFALTYPEKVRSLALLCTFSNGAAATKPSFWLVKTGIKMKIGSKRSRRQAFLGMIMPKQVLRTNDLDSLAQELEPLFGHDLAIQPKMVNKQLSAMGKCDVTLQLPQLAAIKTLVISAEQDKVAKPEFGRALASNIPNARFILIKDAAHGVTLQKAETINRLLAEHFSSNT